MLEVKGATHTDESEVDQPKYTSSHSSLLDTTLAASSFMAVSPEIDGNKQKQKMKALL
jgi:hypothetical protein